MHLLDTDTLTHLFADQPKVMNALNRLADCRPHITVITWIEVVRGRSESVLKAADANELTVAHDRLVRALDLLDETTIIPVDDQTAAVFARFLKTKGMKKIGRADLLIASIALAHGATLVTRNLRHFQIIPGLKLVNWVD